MSNQRLKQIFFSLSIILSLFASSVSACACSYRHEKVQGAAFPCHEHSQMQMTAENHSKPDSPEKVQSISSKSNCCCFQSAPKVFSKSAFVSIEKQTAEVLPAIKVEFETISQIAAARPANFSQPFYLSDLFYNLKSPRAPPVS